MDPYSSTPPTPAVADPPTAFPTSALPADAPASSTSENYPSYDEVTPVEEELRTKLEHFQSKVNQYIREIKSRLPMESLLEASEAIEELEALAIMDLDGPLRTK